MLSTAYSASSLGRTACNTLFKKHIVAVRPELGSQQKGVLGHLYENYTLCPTGVCVYDGRTIGKKSAYGMSLRNVVVRHRGVPRTVEKDCQSVTQGRTKGCVPVFVACSA